MTPDRIRAMTFDCWGTLIHEADTSVSRALRLESLAEMLESCGVRASGEEIARELDRAWERHFRCWEAGVASGSPEVAAWALQAFGITEPSAMSSLARRFSEAPLDSEIIVLEGARDTLELLAEANVPRALVCDTGMTPGRVVRRLLEEARLMDFFPVQIYSGEVGQPKPSRRPFAAALSGLAADASCSTHVGDRRRTDVAGARAMGMATIRIRDHYDDCSEHPDADIVVDNHVELRRILEACLSERREMT